MQTNEIMAADFNDIVFDDRNKEYGAYQIRRKYPRHVTIGLIIAISFLLLVLFLPKIIAMLKPEEKIVEMKPKNVTVTTLAAPPPLDETKPPPPPVQAPPPPKTIQFVPPKITEKQVNDEPPPTIKEVEKAPTSTTTTEGPVTNYTPPPENVVIKQPEPDNTIYEFVDQQPEYPGGYEAFAKWISDHIQYPPFANENGISGTVYLKAVVGEDGRISDVQVLKPVNGLTDEAVRVLKASPPWNPGKQNGRPVKVRITVPIKFVLQ